MNQRNRKTTTWIILLGILMLMSGCAPMDPDVNAGASSPMMEAVPEKDLTSEALLLPGNDGEGGAGEALTMDQDGYYTSREDVGLYLHLYGQLPLNFITKSEAAALGWEASKGNLWEVTDQKSIGGDGFGNREGLLPARSGRQYYECDINYEGGYRGAERIVYSNDGLVYYTPDHYESFELLYGEE